MKTGVYVKRKGEEPEKSPEGEEVQGIVTSTKLFDFVQHRESFEFEIDTIFE